MTLPPLDPSDELASAHLDGLTSEAEADRIAADPELLARVDRLRVTREAIRLDDGPPDRDRREIAIAAAIAAFPSAGDGAGSPASLEGARARRDARARRTTLIAAAAAVALAALLVPRLAGDDDRSGTVVASPDRDDSTSKQEATTFTAPGGEAADSGLTGGATPMVAVEPVEIGDVADLDELARRVALLLDTPSESPSSTTGPPGGTVDSGRASCVAAMRAQVESQGGTVVYAATATVGGVRVAAVAAVAESGARRLAAASLPDCAPLAPRPL